jgi:hypothetical protein
VKKSPLHSKTPPLSPAPTASIKKKLEVKDLAEKVRGERRIETVQCISLNCIKI